MAQTHWSPNMLAKFSRGKTRGTDKIQDFAGNDVDEFSES